MTWLFHLLLRLQHLEQLHLSKVTLLLPTTSGTRRDSGYAFGTRALDAMLQLAAKHGDSSSRNGSNGGSRSTGMHAQPVDRKNHPSMGRDGRPTLGDSVPLQQEQHRQGQGQGQGSERGHQQQQGQQQVKLELLDVSWCELAMQLFFHQVKLGLQV